MDVSSQIASSVFCAFSVFICGLLAVSLVLGAYVFYASDIGGEINHEYPVNSVIGMYGGSPISAINDITIGQIFAIVWAITVGVFIISMIGPKHGYFFALEKMRTFGSAPISNYMFQATKWFSILVLTSVIIVAVQNVFGLETLPPDIKNNLVGFYQVSNAPYIEEGIFRILLIGIPLYMIYSHKVSASHMLKSLWNPNEHLHIERKTFTLILICATAILFGAAHVLIGESWSEGKIAQATIAGIILGWTYFRHGFIPALLIHIMANYMIFAVTYSAAAISGATIIEVNESQFVNTLEILLFIAGIFAVLTVVLEMQSKRCNIDL
ncbi:MAG: abortive infection protein [Cenarchaeum symbiont of Oopsacas minuta]|nr:abortive infection protein [Cenarchaeum symbiont of Oopsacas minuta]